MDVHYSDFETANTAEGCYLEVMALLKIDVCGAGDDELFNDIC
jgi:hypothetical protein